jgi:hypothetical protein
VCGFSAEQADRFELTDETLPLPTHPAFARGTFLWTETAADALLRPALVRPRMPPMMMSARLQDREASTGV